MTTQEPLRLPAGKQAQTPKTPPLEMAEPHNREAEEMLVGLLLGYPERMGEALSALPLGARDFYVDRMREIFAVMQSLDAEGQGIDSVTVANKLAGTGGDFTATWAELMALEQMAPVSGFALDYARIIAAKARRRRDINLARALVHDAYLEPSEAAYSTTRMALADGVGSDRGTATQSRFRVRALSELRTLERAELLDAEMQLHTDELLLLYAKENVGKSAYALYRLARLAAARKHVVYVCGEGLSGVLDRMDGIIAAHELDAATVEEHFHIVAEAPQFMTPADIREFIGQAQDLPFDLALVTVDTLSTAIEAQNENAPEVMSAAYGGMRRIMRELGCAGMLIHHAGKDATRGERGHSNLAGALDVRIMISGEEGSDLITLTINKARYSAKGRKFCYQLRPIALDDYATHTTIVAFPSDARPADDHTPATALMPVDYKMVDALHSLACGLRHGAWVAQAKTMFDISPATAGRSITRLSDAGIVGKDQESGLYQVLKPLSR
jgi:hypothetical protein